MSFGMENYLKTGGAMDRSKAHYESMGGVSGVPFGAPSVSSMLGQAPRMVTIPEKLEDAEKSLYELGNTLERTLDVLVGPRHCDPSAPVAGAPCIEDILGRISRQLSAVHETANSIHRQIVRQ